MSKLLEMKGISKSFYGTQALKDVNIQIEPGEIQAVCGENGAGKSTLMNIMTGILQPNEGEIIFEGKHPEYQTFKLKNRLFAEGYKKNECEKCGQKNKWKGESWQTL